MNKVVALLALVALASACGSDERRQAAADETARRAREAVQEELAQSAAPAKPARRAEPAPESADPRLTPNLMIVFDGSGSMKGKPMAAAKESVSGFLRQVPPWWNVGLYVFDAAGARIVLRPGRHDAATLESKVSAIEAGGGTPLGRAMEDAFELIAQQRERQQGYGRYILLVVTDGEAGDGDLMKAAAEKIAQSGITLDVIGCKIGKKHTLHRYATNYRAAGDQKQLESALAESLAESEEMD